MWLNIIIRFKIVLVVLLLGITPSQVSASETPSSRVIDDFHADLLSVMKKATVLSARERYKKLEPSLDRAFEFNFMIKLAAGSAWRKASKWEKSNLSRAFRRISIANYVYRFNGYSGQRFDTIKTTPAARKTKLVLTNIIIPRKNKQPEVIKLTYVTKKFGTIWKIIDILLNGGISELSVKHSEYRTILRTGGLQILAEKLNKKADELLLD